MKKNNKSLLILVLAVILVISIPIFVYLYNLNKVAFNEELYIKKFTQYNIYSKLIDNDIDAINMEVLDYIRTGGDELIGNDFFTDREKDHFYDVKNVVQSAQIIYYISIFILILFSILIALLINNFLKFLLLYGKILFMGGLLTFILSMLLLLGVLLSFTGAFDVFHNIFFEAGTFTFNPQYEKVVVLYPPELFNDFTTIIIVKVLLMTFFIILLGLWLVLRLGSLKMILNKKLFKST